MKHDVDFSSGFDSVSSPGEKKMLAAAAQFLDAETAQLDARTCAALTESRIKAAENSRAAWWKSGWLPFSAAGMGVAMAASLTALVIMPQLGGDAVDNTATNTHIADTGSTPASPAVTQALIAQDESATNNAFAEIAFTDETDTALADELAFVAWLEENHDPS